MKIGMKRYMVVMLVIGLMVPVLASAQNIDRARNKFQQEYWQTNQVINRAQNVIEEANRYRHLELVRFAINASEKILVQARQLQDQAREQLNASDLTHIQIGNAHTTRARELAWDAISVIKKASDKIVRQADENENLVLRQLEKADQLIDRIKSDVNPEDAGNRMMALFDSARENQRRAWEMFRNGNLRPALKLSNQAEKSLHKIEELLQAETTVQNRLRNQLHQLEMQLAQTRERLQSCESNEAAEFLTQAQHAYQEAVAFAAQNQPGRAEQAYKNARKFARKASAMCDDQDLLENRIRFMNQELERLAETIGPDGDPAVRKLMEKAREHLRKATGLCERGDREECAANIKAAQFNIQKAKQMAGM